MSIGSLEPPCVKILGGSSDAMHVRVFEPPADPTLPPPGAEQSPFSVFQSAVPLPGSSNTLPSISNASVGATAHATVAVARIAAAPRGAKNRVELKYRTNPQMVRIEFSPWKGDVSHFGHRDTIGRRHELAGQVLRLSAESRSGIGEMRGSRSFLGGLQLAFIFS